eukprot:TRINITY_DN7058_c0_g1_i1.p1 TRINITY_DN7058_c0_g1~~TRINITY_DN7058_c0_g1_i1.p1  ORF type:complete len:482 (+),score=36.69 TRINITY_DN7058_c0_g1_i1:185-1630(+)
MMESDAIHYYLHHYLQHFNTCAMRDALACIPQVMMWDDHDIFDGWGSYPQSLQNCPVFQGLYQIAVRFYLLFQQHTTRERISQENDLFDGVSSFAWERRFGNKVHVFALDERGQRTQHTILPEYTWSLVWQRLHNIPPEVEHLVFISSTTIMYPEVPLAEHMLELLSNMNKVKIWNFLMSKTGLAAKLLEFDEPSLLDDLQDHWTAAVHREERRNFINQLQDFSQKRGIRVSFLAGDVHLCCAAQFYSVSPKISQIEDFRYMPQLVSSAIVNEPPPEKLVRLLHLSSQARKGDINSKTKEKFVKLFKDDHKGHPKLLPRRNWLEVCLHQESNEEADNLDIQDVVQSVRDYRVQESLQNNQQVNGTQSQLSTVLTGTSSLEEDFDQVLKSVVRMESGISEQEEENGDEDDQSNGQEIHGQLIYTLRVEDPKNIGAEPETFTVKVPPLRLQLEQEKQRLSAWKRLGRPFQSVRKLFTRPFRNQ